MAKPSVALLKARNDNDVLANRVTLLQGQIDRLASFIMEHVEGEPSQSEGAVDTAIRVLKAYIGGEAYNQDKTAESDARIVELEQLLETTRGSCVATQGDVDRLTAENATLVADQQKLMSDKDGLRDALNNAIDARTRAAVECNEARLQRDATNDDNDRLREHLHNREIEVARLEGVLERVREFDPVSDRDTYEDGKPRVVPPMMTATADFEDDQRRYPHSPGHVERRQRPRRWFHRQRA